ncbi:MAG TPA: sec-independent translocase [Trebonia sp.]
MFDLSLTKLLVLAVIALVVFGPHELPKIASQAGRALRDLRRIAEGAKADLREGLGPEFQDFDFEDLSPRRFVQKHLMDDASDAPRLLLDDADSAPGAALGGTGASVLGGVGANGARTTLLDGEDPPYDLEAT